MKIHHATKAKAAKFKIVLSVEDNEVVATGKDGTRLAAGLQGNKVLEDAITRQTGKPAKGTPEGKIAAKAAPKPGKTLDGYDAGAMRAASIAALKRSAEADPYETLAKEDGWKKTRWGFSKEGEESVHADSWQALCQDQGLELETDDSDADQSKSIVKAKYKAKYKPTKDKCGDELSFRIHDHVSREDDAGELKVNLDLLRNFAKANECWVPAYASLRSRTGAWNAGMARMNIANRLRARLRRIAKEQGRPFNIDKDIVWN